VIQGTALLIAYHFPPIHGSSGVQRTLRFAQHLPSFGWRPVVLTITPSAYEHTRESKGNEYSDDLIVHRSFGFDTARQLSIKGRYLGQFATPDRWMTWRWWAVRDALRLIGQYDIDVVWSTFPIATAHKIGLDVARRSGRPWIAEFRDPMWQGDSYPTGPRLNRAWQRMESDIFDRAETVVVTTPGAAAEYARRFPRYPPQRIQLIENGYDEEVFQRAARENHVEPAGPLNPSRPITLLHSGIIYPSERDPTQFFSAIHTLKASGHISGHTLQIILRASGYESDFRQQIAALNIDDIVLLLPPIDYVSAVGEMMSVDGLLILQASNCNAQIPAKLYEYFRAGRPILALTEPGGDTARILQESCVGTTARLNSSSEIASALVQFIAQIRTGSWARMRPDSVARYSRKSQAGQLAHVMSAIVAGIQR
jgi:glycosyltransferase involved in cell wall biosynthesis